MGDVPGRPQRPFSTAPSISTMATHDLPGQGTISRSGSGTAASVQATSSWCLSRHRLALPRLPYTRPALWHLDPPGLPPAVPRLNDASKRRPRPPRRKHARLAMHGWRGRGKQVQAPGKHPSPPDTHSLMVKIHPWTLTPCCLLISLIFL
jgi:hypothetical protein